MNNYVKHLCIKSSLDDIVKHCAKLLEWMPLSSAEIFEYNDVEILLKCAVFLYECNRLWPVVQNLTELESFFKTRYKSYMNVCGNIDFIASLNYRILRSPNSLRSAVLLDNIFKHLKQIYPTLLTRTPTTQLSQTKVKKLDLLVNRIFQLPLSQIDAVLEKVVCHIEFDIIGLLFCEDVRKGASAKYVILEDKLCNVIKTIDSNINKYFLRSIIAYVGKSVDGVAFYKKCCIENEHFLDALCQFFLDYLCNVRQNKLYHFIPTSEVLYLLKITLEIKKTKLNANSKDLPANFSFVNILTQLYVLYE